MGKKKKKNKSGSDSTDSKESGFANSSPSDTNSGSVSEKTKVEVLPVAAKKPVMPGAILKGRRQPPWYNVRILEEERPDLLGPNGKLNLEKEDAVLMDMFIRDKSDLQTGDLIITDDNYDEDDRHFNRYEVQLKYNEGRYTALYLISKQVCANNELQEKNVLYAMKTSIRPNSANIVLRMKRELRILNEMKKSKCPYSPLAIDSGRVADLPFIVMNLLDRNLEKLREQMDVFKPATVFYIAMETMSALAFLHSHKYIHRDVKLTNICIGAGQAITRIFLIDYGDTVKSGKKIRYGTPDVFTLPYWSLDAHKRAAARERGDAESWFYVVVDLLHPGSLPWHKMNAEADVQAAKQTLWTEGQNLTENQHVHLLQELLRATSGNSFDHETAKMIVRDALDNNRSGPLTLEWAPPAVKINLPQVQQTSIRDIKARIEDVKKGVIRTSDKAVKPASADAPKKPAEAPAKATQAAAENAVQMSSRRKARSKKVQDKTEQTATTKASKEPATEAKTGDAVKGSTRGKKSIVPAPRKARSKEAQPNKPSAAPRRLLTARGKTKKK